jgi:hypothetical protein
MSSSVKQHPIGNNPFEMALTDVIGFLTNLYRMIIGKKHMGISITTGNVNTFGRP